MGRMLILKVECVSKAIVTTRSPVTARDLGSYLGAIENVFARYGIPALLYPPQRHFRKVPC